MALIDRSPRAAPAVAAVIVAVVLLAVVLLAFAGPAHAHIESQPATMEAGTRGSIGFLVEHGCDGGLETTSLEINLPPGVGNPVPGAVPGWTATVAGPVVTFSGGPLGHDTAATFPIELTAPSEAGQLTFPTLQRCGAVVERWIELPVPGQNPEDLDLPAPVVTVTPSTTTTTAPATTSSGAGADAAPPDVSASVDESESESTSPWVYAGVTLLVAAIVATTIVVVRARRDRSGPTT